jgi:hypothetical protein
MKYRMHKRVETKPDGRKIYYYTFEPAEAQQGDALRDAYSAPTPGENTEPSPASASSERRT